MKIIIYIILILVIMTNSFTAYAQRSGYCRYCFEFNERSFSRTIEISNIFSLPARINTDLDYKYRSYLCFDEIQLADYRRQDKIDEHKDWIVKEIEKKDDCNSYQEERIVKQQESERKRQEDQDRIVAAEIAANKIKLQEQDKLEQEKEREALVDFYQQQSPKPDRIADGWHECTIVTLLGKVEEGHRFRVQNNRVVERVRGHRPQFDRVWEVSSGPISKGSIKVLDNGDFYDVFFINYIRNQNSRAAPPVQDERALWWLDELDPKWQDIISGKNGKAYAGDNLLQFDGKMPTRRDLDLVEQVTRIELPAESWAIDLRFYSTVINSSFSSLKEAELVFVDDDFQLCLPSLAFLNDNWSIVNLLITDIDRDWQTLLSGFKGPIYGAFHGDFQITIDLQNIKGETLTEISEFFLKVTRLNLAPDMIPSKIPISLFPNLQKIDLRGNKYLSWFTLNSLPGFRNLTFIYACETEAAQYWDDEMNTRKKREQFVTEIREKYPKLERIEFCNR